jgi:hypothetical protein
MKLLPVLAFSRLLSFRAYAQMDPEMNSEERQAYENRQKESNEDWKKLGVRSKSIYRVEDGDSTPTWKYEFDKEGRTTSSTGYRKNGKEKERWDFTWDDQGRMTSNRKSRNGKVLSGASWTYSGTNPEPVEILWKKKDGKVSSRVVKKYDAKDNLVMSQGFYGKNLSKSGWRYEYDYYENGSKKEARYYNPKGKLKEVYTYDCNKVPMTEKQMMKDTTKTCIKYETDADGNTTKIIEELDEKGRLSVTKLTRNKNGHLIAAIETNHKGHVLWAYTWEVNGEGMVLKATTRYIKGLRKFSGSYVHEYDTEGKIVHTAAVENNKAREYVSSYSKF